VRTKSGATVYRRSAGPAATLGAAVHIDRQALNVAARNTRSNGGTLLTSFGDWIALFYPVSAEVTGNIQSFDIAEAEQPKLREGGTDIRALVPRAAGTVENDRRVFGQLGDTLSQQREAAARATGACILGGYDMRLVKEFAEANLQNERPHGRVSPQSCGEGGRL
jgi:hypothetical protein